MHAGSIYVGSLVSIGWLLYRVTNDRRRNRR